MIKFADTSQAFIDIKFSQLIARDKILIFVSNVKIPCSSINLQAEKKLKEARFFLHRMMYMIIIKITKLRDTGSPEELL